MSWIEFVPVCSEPFQYDILEYILVVSDSQHFEEIFMRCFWVKEPLSDVQEMIPTVNNSLINL